MSIRSKIKKMLHMYDVTKVCRKTLRLILNKILLTIFICALITTYFFCVSKKHDEITKVVKDIRYSSYDIVHAKQRYILYEVTRRMVEMEMQNYNYNSSGVQKLENLLLEKGGKPVRSFIVSTWRSGSSFLGDLINAVPGTFYNYEPLMKYGGRQIRGPSKDHKTTQIIKNMLKCNFTGLEDFYFKYAKTIREDVDMVLINTRLWNTCSYKEDVLCYDPAFVSKLCTLFPFQIMKTVRYRLPVAKQILDDKELDTRLVLLVRDPRAVMKSREKFCKEPDCYETSIVCDDMARDYDTAVHLSLKYPDRFMAVRYEDLILNLNTTVNQLFKLLRLSRTPSVDRFLKLHTTTNDTKQFSTYRLSKEIPFRWRTSMKFSEVAKIQDLCQAAMIKWGYVFAQNASHLISDEFLTTEQLLLY